jgi:hypothetical protein
VAAEFEAGDLGERLDRLRVYSMAANGSSNLTRRQLAFFRKSFGAQLTKSRWARRRVMTRLSLYLGPD